MIRMKDLKNLCFKQHNNTTMCVIYQQKDRLANRRFISRLRKDLRIESKYIQQCKIKRQHEYMIQIFLQFDFLNQK